MTIGKKIRAQKLESDRESGSVSLHQMMIMMMSTPGAVD